MKAGDVYEVPYLIHGCWVAVVVSTDRTRARLLVLDDDDPQMKEEDTIVDTPIAYMRAHARLLVAGDG